MPDNVSVGLREPDVDPPVVEALRKLFFRNGYVRPPWKKRAKGLGYGKFRRGFEVRLTAGSRGELREIRKLLGRAGFKPGKPFVKGNLFRQPVYGRESMERFLALVGER